jgi:hypothetical protein
MNKFTGQIERATRVCAVLVTVVFMSSALAYLYLDRVNVTRLDFWLIYDTCLTRSWLKSALLKYTSHSLFFPSFIWLADFHFFHGNQELLAFVGITLLCSSVALLLIPIWRDKMLELNGKIAATLILIVGNFWMGRSFVIAYGGFNCIYSLMMCGVALAFIWVPAIQTDSPRFWLAASLVIVGGFIASFSFSGGFACWPTLLLLAWCLRLPRRTFVLLVGAAFVAVVLFVMMPYRGAPLHAASEPTISSRVLVQLEWLCQLVGTPVSYAAAAWYTRSSKLAASPLLSLWCGAAGLSLAGLVVFPKIVQRNLDKGRLELMGLALLSFSLFAIILVVIGRATLFRLDPGRISATWYFFWSALFWAGLLMLTIHYCESRKWLGWPALLAAVAIAIFAFPSHYQEGVRYRYIRFSAERAATSLINGACDAEKVKILFRSPDHVYHVAAQLRERRLDMFASGLQDWIGLRYTTLFNGHQRAEGLKGSCRVQTLVRCDNGDAAARVVGWARRNKGQAPQTLVIVDPNGVICGVARSTSTNKCVNTVFFGNRFINSPFLGYIRNYDARLQYSVHSADDKTVSIEVIPVQAQQSATR